jgi:hypothetical protein
MFSDSAAYSLESVYFFVCLSLASLLWSVRLGRPYQEHIVPTGITSKVIEGRKPPPLPLPPPQQGGGIRGSLNIYIFMFI